MKAIRISIIAGALLATSGIAMAQPGSGRGQGAEMTRDQAVARAEQRFARLDVNRDGRLTVEEARQGNPARAGRREARTEQRQARRAERRAQRQAGRANGQGFARIDTNRDGQISQEEFAARRAARAERRAQRGQRAGQRGQGGMARLFGQDGVITLDEYRAQALQRFERLDANRDGRVTVAERREVREQRRSRRQARPQG